MGAEYKRKMRAQWKTRRGRGKGNRGVEREREIAREKREDEGGRGKELRATEGNETNADKCFF